MNKWDTGQHGLGKSSLEAAAEAAARVNAMLIAKGKLKPSQLSQIPTAKPKASNNSSGIIVTEVEINDVPPSSRNLLTRGSTQDEISRFSGAAVSTRGRYMTADERQKNTRDRPLFLYIQGPSQGSIDLAVQRINQIVANGFMKKGNRGFPPVALTNTSVPPRGLRPQLNQPPPLMSLSTQLPELVYQEKLYIGLEHAPPSFDVKNKILGPGGAFLLHIQAEAGAKVTLRGKGSGSMDVSGREAFEPMFVHVQHNTPMGLQQAKQLAENLIQTVQQEYAQFQQALAAMPPALSPATATILTGLPQPSGPPGTAMIPGINHLVSVAQPVTQLTNHGVPGLMAPIASSVMLPSSSTLVSVTPTLLGAQSGLQVSNAPSMVVPSSLMSSLTPVSVAQTVTGAPLLADPQVPPPSSVSPQMEAAATLLQNTALPPPVLPPPGTQTVTQLETMVTYTDPQLLGATLASSLPGTILMSQNPAQPLAQMTMPPAPLDVSVPAPNPAPVVTPIAQPLMTSMQPPQYVLSQTSTIPTWGAPAQLQAPLQTIIQPNASSHPPVPLPSASDGQTIFHQSSLGQPMTITVASSDQPLLLPPQSIDQSTGMSMVSNSQPVSISGPIYFTSAASAPTNTVATSGYTYPPPPREEPKRRFTEEKQEERLPENLLGYEHGPPHLANLVVSGPPPSSSLPVGGVPQSDGSNSAVPPPDDTRVPPPGYLPSNSAGVVITPPPTLTQSGELNTNSSDGDKKLMPPPPAPTQGTKRSSPTPPGPDKKKCKGALGSVSAYGSDEEDEEVQSSLKQQMKEAKKYSFNQYSNKAQMYIEGPPPQETETEEFTQQNISLQYNEQLIQAQQQPQTIPNFIEEPYGLSQIPPPPVQAALPHMAQAPVQPQPPHFVQPQLSVASSVPYSVSVPSYIHLTHSQASLQRPTEQLPLFTNVPPPSLQQPPPALGQPPILTSQATQHLYGSPSTPVPPFSGQAFTQPPPPTQPAYQPPPIGVSFWGGPT